MPAALTCQHCRSLLDAESLRMGGYHPCPGCGQGVGALLFPAGDYAVPVPAHPSKVVADESACYYHSDLQASAACDRCGRFLCALCDLPLGSGHFCAPCIETGRKDGSLPQVSTGSTRWDVLVLFLALLPMVIFPLFYFSLLTAPLALGLGVFFWRRPVSILPRHRTLTLIGMALALIQAGLWAAGLFWIFYQIMSG